MSKKIDISTIFDGVDKEIEAARKSRKPSERQALVSRSRNGIDPSKIFDGVDKEIEAARKSRKPSERGDR